MPDPTAGTRLALSGEDSAEPDACSGKGGTPPKAAVARNNYNAVMQLAKAGFGQFHKRAADGVTDGEVTESPAGLYGWAYFASMFGEISTLENVKLKPKTHT